MIDVEAQAAQCQMASLIVMSDDARRWLQRLVLVVVRPREQMHCCVEGAKRGRPLKSCSLRSRKRSGGTEDCVKVRYR